MANDTDILREKINRAEKILNSNFGIDSASVSGEGTQSSNSEYSYLSIQKLNSLYAQDGGKDVTAQLLSIAKTIREMRSSYLPYEFFIKSNLEDPNGVNLSQDYAKKEPYENTFFRMLGMPSIYSTQQETFPLSIDSSLIKSSDTIKVINRENGRLEDVNYNLVKFNVFEQRKLPSDKRVHIINNNIYRNYDASTRTSFQSTELQVEALAGITTIELEGLTPEQKADLFSLQIVSQNDEGIYNVTKISPEEEESPREYTFDPRDSRFRQITRENDSENFKNPFFPGESIDPVRLARVPLSQTAKLREEVTANIGRLTTDLYKFYYLLFPPIQEAEIGNAINETSKIIAPPFSPMVGKKINNYTVKPTLLETIIRIRLDKVSGTQVGASADSLADQLDPTNPDGDLSNAVSTRTVDDTVPTPDDYGILESLIILRLRAALDGLAKKIASDIESVSYQMNKIQRIPITPPQDNPDRTNSSSPVYDNLDEAKLEPQTDAEVNAQIAELGLDDQQAEKYRINKVNLAIYKRQKVIEDSILALLGDNSEVLELQANTQRRSSIYDSQLMTSLVSVIDIPRKKIDKDIKSIKSVRDRRSAEIIDPLVQSINSALGTDIGVGTIDVVVYCLALFTIEEKYLLGLLTRSQLDTIKNGEFKGVLDGVEVEFDIVNSINQLSILAYSGYKLFQETLVAAQGSQGFPSPDQNINP